MTTAFAWLFALAAVLPLIAIRANSARRNWLWRLGWLVPVAGAAWAADPMAVAQRHVDGVMLRSLCGAGPLLPPKP